MAWYRSRFPTSMTVGERKAKALRAAEKLGRQQSLDPVAISGPLAATWWGKAWNQNLEGYADYSNRLPRGRSYARHGSVIDLRIEAGSVAALVQGSRSSPYKVNIAIDTVGPAARKALSDACAGKLDSAEALLEGRFPEALERLLTSEKTGLFPHPRGIRFSCSCPDSASLCKHVAAALYGVGSRLDRDPSLFFLLRKIEMQDLVSRAVSEETHKLLRPGGAGESARLSVDDRELGLLFGIDLQAAGLPKLAPGIAVPRPVPGQRGNSRGPGSKKEDRRAKTLAIEIRSALDSLEALAADLGGLEAELNSLLRSGRRRNSPDRQADRRFAGR